MRKIDKLFYRWLAAERLWTREIERRFGLALPDVRYLPAGAGVGDPPGSKLQRYAAAFHACRIAWTAESQRMRGEAQ
jgi:hypothetical protein